MRTYVYASVALAFVSVFLVWLLKCGVAMEDQPVSSWLAIAGVLVAVATIASISFAVIIFLATTGLRKEVEEARASIQRSEEDFVGRMSEIQGIQYSVATATIKGLVQAFMLLTDVEASRAGLGCLRFAEIEIHLARETKRTLEEAIQMAFKYSKRRFLEMEPEIWAKTSRLERSEVRQVRAYYTRLKDILLGPMKLS